MELGLQAWLLLERTGAREPKGRWIDSEDPQDVTGEGAKSVWERGPKSNNSHRGLFVFWGVISSQVVPGLSSASSSQPSRPVALGKAPRMWYHRGSAVPAVLRPPLPCMKASRTAPPGGAQGRCKGWSQSPLHAGQMPYLLGHLQLHSLLPWVAEYIHSLRLLKDRF